MAFGALASITAEGTALSGTDAIDAPRGHGDGRAGGCPTAATGVVFVLPPPPPPPQEYSQANTRLCNNRVTAQAVSTAGNIPAMGRNAADAPRNPLFGRDNAAETPRNLPYRLYYAPATRRNRLSSRKYASGTLRNPISGRKYAFGTFRSLFCLDIITKNINL
jgi:hypothetical protein